MDKAIRIVSWNINHQDNAWATLLNSNVDIALLQEAKQPPAAVRDKIQVDDLPWTTAGNSTQRAWRTCIARFSERVELRHRSVASIDTASAGQLAVSRMGTLSVADMEIPGKGGAITLVSLYGAWETPAITKRSSYCYADASVHRLISDLSALITRKQGRAQRLIVAGDLNILYGYGEHGSSDWKARYDTIFSRMEAIGLPFIGPQAPDGRMATPWPEELPTASKNVPTYYTSAQKVAGANRQLDFVFASDDVRQRIRVRALNAVDEWGLSDHCQILIEVQM